MVQDAKLSQQLKMYCELWKPGPAPGGRRGPLESACPELVGISDTRWPTGLLEDLRLQADVHNGIDFVVLNRWWNSCHAGRSCQNLDVGLTSYPWPSMSRAPENNSEESLHQHRNDAFLRDIEVLVELHIGQKIWHEGIENAFGNNWDPPKTQPIICGGGSS